MCDKKKWKTYFIISLLIFASFLLEYASIFAIEVPFLRFDISNYSTNEQSVHHLITVVLWIIWIGFLYYYTKIKKLFINESSTRNITKRNWILALLCLLGCKIMTFIDWHTFKIIGEAQGKELYAFVIQYIYYFAEMVIVVGIIICGQKAFETLRQKKSMFPYGGIVLAFTWGMFHFVSRGVGIEVWNGISCMIFSILSGIIYVNLDRSFKYSYIVIAIGYLL